MTSLQFLNGLNTIGGNIVAVSQGDSRIIMDFGVAADLSHETVASAIDHGKLPNVPELFFDQPDGYAHEAIFISHLHIDHMGALQYLKKDIPIYLSEPSYKLYKTLIALGIEKPVANLHPLAFETPQTIGSLTVTGYASDHDEPGVMALLVFDGRHYYGHSGDVRLNGPHPENVKHWAQVFHDKHLKFFMIEGTTFSFDSDTPVEDSQHPSVPLTETSLQEKLLDVLKTSSQLVVINPYIRNWQRLAAIQRTAHLAGRIMVWEKQDAAVLTAMTGEKPDAIIGESVQKDDLLKTPEKYLLQNDYPNLDQLADLPVSAYCHSNGEPLGDYDPRFAKLLDFLKQHEIPITYLSCSGHAVKADLITLAKWVAPQIIVPWHSFKPEAEAKALDAQTRAEVLLPEKDLLYTTDAPED